jgi:hypothetical protein
MSLHILDFKVHNTSPQFRAGLLHILDFVLDNTKSNEQSHKEVLLKQISNYVSNLEVEYKESEFQKGLYSGFGWYHHILHNINVLDSTLITELKTVTESLRREITVMGKSL